MVPRRINRFSILMCLALILIIVEGCYYDNEEELYGITVCNVTNVSFANDIMPIIQGNCAVSGCHIAGGSGNGIMENYSQVKAKVDNGSFQHRVLDLRDMPPSYALTDCQIQYLQAWIDAGAPDN